MKERLIILIFSFALILTLISCKKEHQNSVLNGFYTESSPVSGRSKLEFLIGDKVTLIRDLTGNAGSSTDTYYYKLTPGSIKLIPVWINNDPGISFEFIQFNNDSFRIANLYPSIPEAPKIFMTFKK